MTAQGLIRKEKNGRAVHLVASHLGVSLLKAWRAEFHAIQAQLNSAVPKELRVVA